MNKHYLYGLDDGFIDYHSLSFAIHRQVITAFKALQAKAALAGFSLTVASCYRNYERQLAIWNDKAGGVRLVLDNHGESIDLSQLDPWEQVQAILRWSALPGASRHHWGTDIDVYDASAVSGDYQLQLTADEVNGDGPFVAIHNWLDQQIKADGAEGFFRPYQQDTGGIAPERWHLSFAPLASYYQQQWSIEQLLSIINSQPMALKDSVIEHIEEIFQRYITVAEQYYPSGWRNPPDR